MVVNLHMILGIILEDKTPTKIFSTSSAGYLVRFLPNSEPPDSLVVCHFVSVLHLLVIPVTLFTFSHCVSNGTPSMLVRAFVFLVYLHS
jgi:ABC-type transport system involved in multi-copper enzyme maturation permease subunit